MTFRSHTLPEFWECYEALPESVQMPADKQFARFETNPHHPSLQLKPAGFYWSVRVSLHYRALARRRDADLFWFWIGHHSEYDMILRRS